MGVEKTFGDVVRIFVVIHMFMMAAMFAGPHEDRILERSGAKDEYEQTHRESGPESHVRKQTVITSVIIEPGGGKHPCKTDRLKQINAKIQKEKCHGVSVKTK